MQLNLTGNSNNLVKGHEPKLCEALRGIAGLFFKITLVMMKGPNKSLTANISKPFLKDFVWSGNGPKNKGSKWIIGSDLINKLIFLFCITSYKTLLSCE